jgi:hypothetical protein
MPTILN